MYFGRMLSPVEQNMFLSCSQFRVSINELVKLPAQQS